MEQKDTQNIYVKKTEMYLVSSVLVLFIIIFGIVLLISQRPQIILTPVTSTTIKEEITENVFNENIEEPEQTDKTIYIVKEYNGKIGVFKENALIYTMDIHIFTLPEYDKNLLACGIKAEGIDELYRILGEYYK
jgi:hypothetical protein